MKRFSFYLLLGALVAMWSGVSSAIKEDLIILYLPLDDKKDVTEDLSGNGNDGKLMGDSKWAEGKVGNALEMSGKDYITVAHNKSLNWGKELTVCGWFYFTGDFARNNNLFDKRLPGAWADGGFNIWVTDKGRNYGITFSGPWGYMMTKEGIKKTEKWYHLTCVGDAKGGKIYLDGKEIKELQAGAATDAKMADANSDQPLIIGQRADLIDGLFGRADEIAIWKAALTVAEIETVMRQGPRAVQPTGKLTTTWGSIKKECSNQRQGGVPRRFFL